MRASLKVFARGILTSALFLSLHACSGNSPTDSGTKKDDSTITVNNGKPKKGLMGFLVGPGGSPLKGASVKAILQIDESLLKVSAKELVGTDSVVSDSNGMFVFTSLVKGTYNIQAVYNKGELVILIKNVKYDGEGSLVDLKTEIMRGPGKISGSFIFEEGDSVGILCAIPGTSYSTLSNGLGIFSLTGIPQGTYTLTFSKVGFKTLQDTGVTVKAGEISKLTARELEADPAFPPPPPSGFKISYDTLTGKATLRWQKVKVEDLYGYFVYRNLPSEKDPTRLGSTLLKDTFYVDDIFTSASDSTDKEYTYRLKSQDLKGTLSGIYSKPITLQAVAPTKVRTIFTWKTSGTKGDSASIGDTVTVTASWSNPSRKIVKIAFYIDSKNTPAAAFKDSSLKGSNSFNVSKAKSGSQKIFVEATDVSGAAIWDSLSIFYLMDAPIADAGKDTSANIHSKINFAGSATQTFGTIVKYSWDFDGDDVIDDSSANGLASHVYDHGAAYVVKLVVRDDDGNESFDLRSVQIINQDPVVTAVRSDTVVSINDPITFTGSGTDADGPVKSFGWDFDGNGTMDTTSTAVFSPIHRYPNAGVFTAIFRVTDDDAGTTDRKVKITVLKDDPVVNAGKDTTMSIKDIVRLHGSATDKYGTIVAWAWDFGGTGTFKVTSNGDTNVTAPSTPSAAWRCVLKVTDDDGNFALDTMVVTVLQDVPIANAGKDTTVSIGDSVKLSGKGTDLYGNIVERAWSIAGGAFKAISIIDDTTIFAPLSPTAYVCSLRVTDDDGQIAKDAMTVTVVQDIPIANAGNDTTIAVGQAVTLKGTATQSYGSVAMYKWDWQDNGSWDDSSATINTTTFTVAQGGTQTVLFGVRDDDGNFVVDTVLVNAVSYVGGTLAGSNTYYKSLSPYVLTSDLTVPSGASLTISAGVNISGPHTILVNGGSLVAVGISADSVVISSPVRFEGSTLGGSQIGFARMTATEALHIGGGVTQNTGTLKVEDVTFFTTKVTAEASGSASKLLLRRVILDSLTLAGTGTGVQIEVKSSTIKNSTVQSSILNQGITLDSSTTLNTSFLVGGDNASITVKNSSLSTSSFKEGTGALPIGPLSLDSCSLSNSTIELPKSVVNFTVTTTSFSTVTPLVKIGLGSLLKAKFAGAGTGIGLEIMGYNGNTVSGATNIDSSEAKNFNIGVMVRNFGTLSITKTNFVNNVAYDLSNQSTLDFNALQCYWSGAASDVNVDTRIRDKSDDASFGKVTFTGYTSTIYVF